jgi:hypothetical protein
LLHLCASEKNFAAGRDGVRKSARRRKMCVEYDRLWIDGAIFLDEVNGRLLDGSGGR